jgi:hypothetical protein
MVYGAMRGNDDTNPILVKLWREAGVTPADWRRAHRAVVALIADLLWRTRGSKEARQLERDATMQRLSRIARATRNQRDTVRISLTLKMSTLIASVWSSK